MILLIFALPKSFSGDEGPSRQTYLIVHRQALEGAPENTWAALKQAVEWGAGEAVTLEVDLHATRDGKIILIHDPFLDPRNGEVMGASGDWLWEEINDIDFGDWYDPRFKDERLPLFEDVLEFCKLNGVRLTLDIKENVTPAMVRTLLRKHDAESVVYYGWVGNFGSLVGTQRWITEFDGDRERIRQIVRQFAGNTVWVDDPRVLLDVLHRDVPKREVRMPVLSRDYRVEDLDFNALVEQLRGGGDLGLIAAARLRKNFADRAAATFSALLEDPHATAEAKATAARALGRMSGALGQDTEAAKTTAIVHAALDRSETELRAAAAYAVGKLKVDIAVPRLLALLGNRQEQEKVRVEAARALGRIGSVRALAPLQEIAREERAKVREHLLCFVERAKGFTRDGYFFRDNSAMYWALPQVLYACYWALGEIGGDEALEFLLACFSAQELPEPDRLLETIFVRVPALNAAAKTGAARALAAAKAYAWEPADDTYQDYIRLTRYFPPPTVISVLLEFLGHPKPWRRQKAMYALLRLGKPAVEPLIALLENPQANPLAREWAVWTLGWSGDHRAGVPLTRALQDPLPGLRAKAAWALGKLRVIGSIANLEALAKEDHALVREYAAEALERLRGAVAASAQGHQNALPALRIHPQQPHYFQSPDGKPLLLIGDYTWGTFSDADFNYKAQFDALKARGLNFARIWLWWGCEEFPEPDNKLHIEPFLRPGPGTANDGRSKYDLARFNPPFFDRLRDFCAAARDRGLFLQLITMDAWMLKHGHLWKLHAYHRDNNINGVDGDPRRTGTGTDGRQGFCSLGNPRALEFQKAYLRKLADTFNDFDNILIEIANENYYNEEWERQLCVFFRECELAMPRRHVLMPLDLLSHSNVVQKWDPKIIHSALLEKRHLLQPLIFDTDWTIHDSDDDIRKAMWAAVLSGGHFNYMDDSLEFRVQPAPDKRARLHLQIGHLAGLMKRLKPWEMLPGDMLVKSGHAFALASASALAAYLPAGGEFTLDLTSLAGDLESCWFDPQVGTWGEKFAARGGGLLKLSAPNARDWALFLQKEVISK